MKGIARSAKIAKIAEIGRQKPFETGGTEEAEERERDWVIARDLVIAVIGRAKG